MKWTKRSRKRSTMSVIRWYMRDRKLNDIEIAIGMPELTDILEDEGEMDFDDVVRAFDYLDVDVVCVPRGDSRALNWFCLTELPYDDGGKNRGWTIGRERAHLRGRRKGAKSDDSKRV